MRGAQKQRGRIAFINSRTYCGGSSLINMPFAFNVVLKLQAEWRIDLTLGEWASSEYGSHLNSNVRLQYISKELSLPYFLKNVLMMVRCGRVGYRAVFGMGQVGAHLARRLAQLNRCPLIIANDEFLSGFPQSRWSALYARAVRAASLIVIPDSNRIPGLCREISGIAAKHFIELLNVPLSNGLPVPEIDWHARIGLPVGSVPLIFVGGVGDHNQVPELLSTVRSWPANWVLIIRAHNPAFARKYRESLQHLDVPGRIFWVLDPLSTVEFDSLLQYCRVSFALYRPENANMTEMGKSSGKLLRSVMLGVPVVASNFRSLDYVTEHRVGQLVGHPAEILMAVREILADGDGYRERCERFTRNQLNYEIGWRKFEEQFNVMAGVGA